MPPQSITHVFGLLFLQLLVFDLTIAQTCYTQAAAAERSSCPPFSSPLSFPFASSPGCGHPSFQIRCSSHHSTISINNSSFALLRLDPNSSSLLLSPEPTNVTNPTKPSCYSATSLIPTRPINFSGSPFRFSDASCSRLSVLRSCQPLSPLNCRLCPWECELLKQPNRLFQDCGSKHHHISEQGCQEDLFGFLQSFLKLGIQVEWDENDDIYFSSCNECQAKNGVCGFNSSDPRKPFLCYRSQTELSPPWFRRDNPNRIVLLCTIFICTCLVLVVAVATVIFRCRGLKSSATEEDPTTLFLHRHRSASLLPPVFSYEELEASTNRFDPRNKIGDGGFGSVYIGQLYDGRIVAVKKLHRQQTTAAAGRATSIKAFCNEILILSSIDHPSLVKLHGYCSDPRGLILVYDYVPNGTLADHLHGSKRLYRKGSLTWQVRVDVALQTAMALEYLHFSVEPPIVHRDITSSNIFVEKDLRIKVGDFGLSRLLVFPESSSGYVWTGPQGTPGYLDPDYHRSFRLTEKSDVYSFGVVLFELISGMKAVDLSRDKREVALADLVVSKIQVGSLHQVVDPVLILEGEAMGTIDAVAELAFRCVAADKDDRPDAKEVVAELKRIRSRTRGHRASNVAPDASKS